MTGKNLEREVRYALDKVLRGHGHGPEADGTLGAARYADLLDAATAEILDVVWAAD